MNTSEAWNIMGGFCGIRDVEELTPSNLQRCYGIKQADVMVLFGGSIICGGDVLANAIKNDVAKKYIIVGGEGHTTKALRDNVQELYPDFPTAKLSESEVYQGYLKRKYNLSVRDIETKSTNCGNNITRLLEMLQDNHIKCDTIILSQDATMQRRMSATLEKYEPDMRIINFATYEVEIIEKSKKLLYRNIPEGMWEIERYQSLLLGEIVRLRDDKYGYGPNGENYIAHVEMPTQVDEAFAYLSDKKKGLIRGSNAKYKELLD